MDEVKLLPIIIHEQSQSVNYNNLWKNINSFPQPCGKSIKVFHNPVENYEGLLVSHSGTYTELTNTQRLKIPWKGTVLTRTLSVYGITV